MPRSSAWLRADPAYVRPDINGARLLAYGDALALTQAERDALLRPLQPLFGDAGFPIDAPTPSRWYLRLPREAKLPAFAASRAKRSAPTCSSTCPTAPKAAAGARC